MMRRPNWNELRADLGAMHAAALAAADPAAAVSRALALDGDDLIVDGVYCRLAPGSRIVLLAAGKAAIGMAGAALSTLGRRVSAGLVVHPPPGPGSRRPESLPAGVARIEGSHPVPDEESLRAGEAALRLVAGLEADDVVLVLLSGGASSLLEKPAGAVSLANLRAVTRALQRAGADVFELNVVRRALSGLKGGGLARAARPARVATLALSDVLGDRPEAIGSGPTVESPTGATDAIRVLERFGVAPRAPEVMEHLSRAERTPPDETPCGGIFRVVASNRLAASAVARAAEERGFAGRVMTVCLQGEAREAGRVIGGFAVSVATAGIPLAAPACLVFGGETTVTVRGEGRGGRNQELALGAALAISEQDRVAVLSFATDGVDGVSEAAGALVTGDTLARAAALGLSPHRALAENDSGPFFAALGDRWTSGPTGTNVNDLALALVYPR